VTPEKGQEKRFKKGKKIVRSCIAQDIGGHLGLQTRFILQFRDIIRIGKKTDIPDRISIRKAVLVSEGKKSNLHDPLVTIIQTVHGQSGLLLLYAYRLSIANRIIA
jgi:hypothetical protein